MFIIIFLQKIYKNNVTGLVVGFIGTFCLIFFNGRNGSINTNIYGLFVVLATLLYGINLNLLKHHLVKLNPLTITSTSLFFISPITIWILVQHTPFLTHINELHNVRNEIMYVLILGIWDGEFINLIQSIAILFIVFGVYWSNKKAK